MSTNSRTIATDAGRRQQHSAIAQGPQAVPQLVISPPPQAEPAFKIKIKKSTPDEFDVKDYMYIEPENEYLDQFEYDRNGNDQGIVIIFNQVKFLFNFQNKRLGSIKDVNDIIFTFGRLGFNIDENYIFSNLGTAEINEKLDKILKEDLSNRNSLIVFYLSHGDEEDTIMTADGQVNTKHIWEKLANHEHLKNKPKFFVFQACKGDSLSTPFEKKPEENVEHKITSISLSSDSLPSDVLLCYSSVEGMKSYRDIEKGSWLIQEICKNFLAYGRRDDVYTLLTRVTKCLSTYMHNNTKQIPVVISTLSKKFYLSKSKDRTNNLAVHQLFEKMYHNLKDLDDQIASLEAIAPTRK